MQLCLAQSGMLTFDCMSVDNPWPFLLTRDVNKARGVKARGMQGQGHRPKVKVKAENVKVNFSSK